MQAETHRSSYVGLVAAALYVLVACAVVDFTAPLRGDEKHFWTTALRFRAYRFPPLEMLRSYEDLNTPLPFLVWAWLERAFHQGIWLPRALNLVLSAVVVWLIGRRHPIALAGLFLCPYFVFAGIYAYTDMMAIFFVIVGVAAHERGRFWVSGPAFVLAIATRQYMAAFPMALLAWEVMRRERRPAALIAPAIALASLGGWYLFFGDFAPVRELAAQRIRGGPLAFRPEHGLYFLSCVGLYYAVPKLLLWRANRPRNLISRGGLGIVAAIGVLFLLFPPLQNDDWIRTMGLFDRGLRFLGLADGVRVAVFGAAACLAVLSLRGRHLQLLLLAANALALMRGQQAWDKYALPLIVVLWYLEADQLRPYRTIRATVTASPSSSRSSTSIPRTMRPSAVKLPSLCGCGVTPSV